MTQPFSFDANRTGAALVIVFPPGVRGLFNNEIHGLVREVQEQLEDVYVTYALSSNGSPDLKNALAAARVAGCDSAVVVPTGEAEVARLVEHGPAGDWMLEISPIVSEMDALAVVDTYQAAVAESERAA